MLWDFSADVTLESCFCFVLIELSNQTQTQALFSMAVQ